MSDNLSMENQSRTAALFYRLSEAAGGRWRMIIRNVLRQGSRNLLLGFLVLFATLVIALFSQVLGGISSNFTKNLVSLASGHVYVASKVERSVDRNIFERDYDFFTLPESFLHELSSMPGVDKAQARLEFDVQVVTPKDTVSFRMMGFDTARELAMMANFTLVEGRMFKPGEFGTILPTDFARRHGLKVGDQVRVLARTVGKQMNLLDFTVTGLFQTTQLSAWFDNYAYLDLAEARTLLDSEGAMTRLNIHLKEGADQLAFNAALTQLLQKTSTAVPVESTPWTEGASFFRDLIQAMGLGYFIVMVIISIMIAASLAFTTMMTIAERTKELATLAAIGATPSTIRLLIVGENLVLAGIATICGTLLAGVLFGVTAFTGIPVGIQELRGFLGSSRFHPAFEPAGFIAGIVLPILVAFLASYLFARRAARLPIAEAMADR